MDPAYTYVANAVSAVPKYIPRNKKDAWRIYVPVAAGLTALLVIHIVRQKHKLLKDSYSQDAFDEKTSATTQQVAPLSEKYAGENATNPLRPKWLNDRIASMVKTKPHLQNKLPLVVDFSAHTRTSMHGMLTPKQLVQWEVCNGYDAVVVTDVCSCAAVQAAKSEAAKIAPGFHVIPGFRVTGASPKMKGYRMCVCGANRVPLTAKVTGSLFYEQESLLRRVSKWANKNNFLVYSDAELPCSKLFDVQDSYPSHVAVVFVDVATWKKDPTVAIVNAVRTGSWKALKVDDDKRQQQPPFVSADKLIPNPKRAHFEQRWHMFLSSTTKK